jgi:hypothetical protein
MALEMSLPLLLSQTRLPGEIVVVDSSDDHAAVEAVVAPLAARSPVPFRLIRSAPGLTIQRNVGIAAITGDVVVFPDDDSLMFPDTIEELMRIYELDVEGAVGGISALRSPVSPLVGTGIRETFAHKRETGLRRRLIRLLLKVETHWIRKPILVMEDQVMARHTLPEPLIRAGARKIARQEGYRMSFRTALVRERPFNERLQGYALWEDFDASYAVARTHALAVAPAARIFHHEFPGKRMDPATRGVIEVLNEAYIVARHTVPGDAGRGRTMVPYFTLWVLHLLSMSHDGYQRRRLRSVLRALRVVGTLLRTPRDDLDQCYVDLRDACLKAA